jgi:hypothetical protein
LVAKGAPEHVSTDALFLVVESRLSDAAINAWGRGEKLSDQELLWLAQVFAKKRSTLFPFVARIIIAHGIVEFPQSVFLNLAATLDAGSGALYEALFNLSKKPANISEVNFLCNCDDPAASQALYGVLLSSTEPEVVKGAMTSLLNKPGVPELVRLVIESILSGGEQSQVSLAPLVGSLGMVEAVGHKQLLLGVQALGADATKDLLLPILLEKGSVQVVGAVLEGLGLEIHPDRLIQLLERGEPQIRKSVVPFLKGVSIASSKTRIREYYEAEKDPDVRRVFESELYLTDER